MKARRLDIREALSGDSLKLIASLGKRRRLLAGETLFEIGDRGTALYFVESGSLGVYLPGPDGDTRLAAVIRPGETVGEMAVISGEPRSATIIAIRDADLLELNIGAFRRIAQTDPALISQLNRLLALRLQQVARGGVEQEPKNIAFLPANGNAPLDRTVQAIVTGMEAMGRRVAVVRRKDGTVRQNTLARLEEAHDTVAFIGAEGNREWNAWCARQSDRIMIVAPGGETPKVDLDGDILRQRASHQLLDLLIVHDGRRVTPGSRRWLEAAPVNRHFHLTDDDACRRRIARILSGAGVGLVLSGGGARAFAHIGALRAIEEHRIPLDFLAGSSMGGIVAACYAMGWPVDKIAASIRAAFVDRNPLGDYCFPMVSLVRGHRVEALLERYFGDVEIEDLARPYFCVSANLTNGLVHVHRNGRLGQALRASIALPGILPPVVIDEGVLVDGGVLDNMPVEAMRASHRGPVIAVDVARDLTLTPAAVAAAGAAGWRHWFRRLPIIDILMRSGTVNGERYNQAQADAADLVIVPSLGDVEIRNWKAFDQIVEAGYRATTRTLSESRHSAFTPQP